MNKSNPETRRYDIRSPSDEWHACKGAWLGTFLITHDGMVAVNSDYGNFGYWWTSTGTDDIRKFLIGIDAGYLLSKIAPKKVLDEEGTKKKIKSAVLEMRRRKDIDADFARQEFDLANNSDLDSKIGFSDWGRETELEEWWEFAEYVTDPQAVAFAERAWPLFVDVLKKEIEAEKSC